MQSKHVLVVNIFAIVPNCRRYYNQLSPMIVVGYPIKIDSIPSSIELENISVPSYLSNETLVVAKVLGTILYRTLCYSLSSDIVYKGYCELEGL